MLTGGFVPPGVLDGVDAFEKFLDCREGEAIDLGPVHPLNDPGEGGGKLDAQQEFEKVNDFGAGLAEVDGAEKRLGGDEADRRRRVEQDRHPLFRAPLVFGSRNVKIAMVSNAPPRVRRAAKLLPV